MEELKTRLFPCVVDNDHPLLGPVRTDPEAKLLQRTGHKDISAAVEAIRQYWMPIRYRRRYGALEPVTQIRTFGSRKNLQNSQEILPKYSSHIVRNTQN
jgi:hypothetical protein